MKWIWLFVTFTLPVVSCSVQKQPEKIQSPELNVMTYNIRYDNPGDAPNNWSNRKKYATDAILDGDVDILGVQEALHNQMNDLQRALKGYKYIGVGREDGKEGGEYSPIFYKAGRFEIVKSGYFWLSETPEVVSKGWDAANVRIATWAKFKDKTTGNIFFVLNTHFDHKGQIARRESVRLLLNRVNEYSDNNSYPVIVTGDFNALPDSDVIKSITDTDNPLHLTNSRAVSPEIFGPDWTFHNFGRMKTPDRIMLDYILVRNNVSVLRYEVIEGNYGNIWLSDHCPILIKVKF